MLKRCTVLVFGAMAVVGSAEAADVCYPLTGRVDTQAIDYSRQVGVVKLEIGGTKLTGGISGTIVSPLGASTVLLNHDMGFPGRGTLVTKDDEAVFTGFIAGSCRMGVMETIHYNSGTGIFANVSSLSAIATGSIDGCTFLGYNSFKVAGQVCYAEGTAPLALVTKND